MNRAVVGKRAGFWMSVDEIITKPQNCALSVDLIRPYAMVLGFRVNSASVKSEPLRAIRGSNSSRLLQNIELKQRLSTHIYARMRTGTQVLMA